MTKKNLVIDMRSDTVTKPSAKMLQSMLKAKVGDMFYEDDCTTIELEKFCATYFGTEDALFIQTGTLANQVALRCHTSPGDEILIDGCYHINQYESAATSDLAKVNINSIYTKNGILRRSDLLRLLVNKHRSHLTSQPVLLCLENTINSHSGLIYPLHEMKIISSFARENKLKIHLDGARLLNACVASGLAPNSYSPYIDSLMVCFSKGLGAPFGSILLGSKKFINNAKKYNKWYGGGLHQSSYMAAAALYAIKNNVKQLKIDHENAKLLANLLTCEKRLGIETGKVQTNIVMLSLMKLQISVEGFVSKLKQNNILLYPWSETMVRAVTHCDVTKNDIVMVADKILSLCKKL